MFDALIRELKKYTSVALGYSGGVDSSLLAYALQQSGVRAVAVTVQTCLQSERELAQSVAFCKEFGIPQRVIVLELGEAVLSNPKDRCYHCKKQIFSAVQRFASEQNYATMMDGNQADDLSGYRPGRRALTELGVVSPLIDIGWGKQTVRAVSLELGLPTAKREAASCLATRLPYGCRITPAVLSQIEAAEELLAAAGLQAFRCRHHRELLRVEAGQPAQAFELVSQRQAELKALGYRFVTVDVGGYQKGCYDEED